MNSTKLLTLEGNYNFSEKKLRKINGRLHLQIVTRENPPPNKPLHYLQAYIGGELKYISSLFPKREKIRGQFINGYKLDYNGYYYFLYFISESEAIIVKQSEKGFYSDKKPESPMYNNKDFARISEQPVKRPKRMDMPEDPDCIKLFGPR